MLVSVVLLGVCICFLFFKLQPRRTKNFPPGPPAVPILGNLLQLSLDNPLKDFERLKGSYGDVYSLFFGSRPAVILNGLKAIKEAMVSKGSDFAGRPQDLFINDVLRIPGVVFIQGPSWKEHRRFALITLKNFGMGKNLMEERIHREIHYVLKVLEKSIGSTMSPQVVFHNMASNIVTHILFGKRFEYGDGFITDVVQAIINITKTTNSPWALLYDVLPQIQNLPLPFRETFTFYEKFQTRISTLVAEHMKDRVPGDPRDFVDCYLDELEKRGAASYFSLEQLTGFAIDLQGAGTDTTANTVLTGFLYLMCYPDIQERCQQEIDLVLEGKSLASFEDRHRMPYVQAVIHEVQRTANTFPLSIFHNTTKDTELMGYTIPKGTMIIENLASVLKEEGKWKFPHEFNPENFLNDQGEFVKQEAFLPFSAGPRACLGEGLARMELFLVMVTLLRKFKFTWPEEAGKPDLTPVFGMTTTTKPYCMRVQERTPQ